jgi:hypothetical protein
MVNYNFLKEAKVYIQYGVSPLYNIDISAVSFSQTFVENSYAVKTIHEQKMFEGSVINKANPADFSFTIPYLKEGDLSIVFSRLLDCATFTLYVSTQQNSFKLENCVMTNGSFVIEKLRPLSLSISGEGAKLSILSGASLTAFQALVAGMTARSATTTYTRVTIPSLLIGGVDISSSVVSLSIELQNEIDWQPYTTVNGAATAVNAATSMYPTRFDIQKKILAGSITRYLADTTYALNWNSNTSLFIRVGSGVGAAFRGYELNTTSCSFTNRIQTSSIFTEEFNWRMTQNPSSLSSVLKEYNNNGS